MRPDELSPEQQILQRLEAMHEEANAIFTSALEGANIQNAFDRQIHFDGDTLIHHPHELLEATRIDLGKYKKIYVIAMGKSAIAMVDLLLARMSRRKGLRGVCSSIEQPVAPNWRIRYFAGGYPLPNHQSMDAAKAALDLLKNAREDTFVFFLVSGGGSALFDLPIDPSISFEDMRVLHETLLASGLSHSEMNIVRARASAVKGGRLALAAGNAGKFSILLPDVPLGQLTSLASSPSLPMRSTSQQALEILRQNGLLEQLPGSMVKLFEETSEPSHTAVVKPSLRQRILGETVREFKPEEVFSGMHLATLLSSHDLVNLARDHAQKLGYKVIIDDKPDNWDYADAALYLLDRFHQLRQTHEKFCLISGGEITVHLNGPPGAGGRNQQFALKCAFDLAQYPNQRLVVFSATSKGSDGNTRSAGAIVDTTTLARARTFGFDPEESLTAFNACPLLSSLGDTVQTGKAREQDLRDLRMFLSDASPVEIPTGLDREEQIPEA